jgi:hypothetical protein
MCSTLDKFKQQRKAILLMTIKKGGTALNIVEADSCIFMEPMWNPQVHTTLYTFFYSCTALDIPTNYCVGGRASACKGIQDRAD